MTFTCTAFHCLFHLHPQRTKFKLNAMNSLLYEIPVFKDLYEYHRKKFSRTVPFAASPFFPFSRTFISAKYLNISHPQKFISAKNLELSIFFFLSVFHVDILETRVVNDLWRYTLRFPLTESCSNKFFSTESGFP